MASIIFFISRLLIAVDHHPVLSVQRRLSHLRAALTLVTHLYYHPVPDRSWGLDWRILLSELVTTMHLVPRQRLELVVDLLEVERAVELVVLVVVDLFVYFVERAVVLVLVSSGGGPATTQSFIAV